MVGGNRMKKSFNESGKVFDIINYTSIALLCIVTLFPFWQSIVVSISSRATAAGMGFRLWPKELDFEAWYIILTSSLVWHGMYNTIIRTLLGTTISMILSVMMAYPLSKSNFPHRKVILTCVIFTMMFSGGTIPMYILVKNLGLMNTIWALVLPAAISPFNIIIIRNFFQSVPQSLEESAKLDGANDIYILYKIILPLSLPVLATMTLWTVVGHWNSWFDAILYINNRKNYVLQAILREIVIQKVTDPYTVQIDSSVLPPLPESVQAAATMFVTLPILMVYPFIQKYFAKGIMLGSVKG